MAFLLDSDSSTLTRRVSPLGASRFEKPLVHNEHELAAQGTEAEAEAGAEAKALPTSTSDPASPDQLTFHPHTLSRLTRPSRASTAITTTTAPTSISISIHDVDKYPVKHTFLDSPSPVDETHDAFDAWISRLDAGDDDDAHSFDSMEEYPDGATLAAVREIPLYDADGNEVTFGSLYSPTTSTHPRQLFIFIRHFYCGACQAYLRALTTEIPLHDYFRISPPTSFIVIGCGQPDLINQYKKFTTCPWPMYAEPSRELFKKLGMSATFNMGLERPEYMKDISPLAWMQGQARTIHKSLKDPNGIRKRDIFRGGNPMQIGGEFLFEAGQVVWCHRMKHYRNHAEVRELRRVLELDDSAEVEKGSA